MFEDFGFTSPSAGVIARDLSEKIEKAIIQHCESFMKGAGHCDLCRAAGIRQQVSNPGYRLVQVNPGRTSGISSSTMTTTDVRVRAGLATVSHTTYQGRVREGLKNAGFAESYRTYLNIRGKSSEDALLPEVRRRAGR